MLNHKGQGLVELIIAIAVIEVGLFSVWSLFLVNFNAEREAEYRIVGVNLAREGIEVIKNIRDSNWLKRTYNTEVDNTIWSWDQNLEAGDYSINFDSQAPEAERFTDIYINNDGFFTNVVTDKKTPYKRKVTLKDICCSDANADFKCDEAKYMISEGSGCDLKIGINVASQVDWEISNKQRRALVEDNFYDWQ